MEGTHRLRAQLEEDEAEGRGTVCAPLSSLPLAGSGQSCSAVGKNVLLLAEMFCCWFRRDREEKTSRAGGYLWT